jgi:hypothetical protein
MVVEAAAATSPAAATWIELQPTGVAPPPDLFGGRVFYDAPTNRLIVYVSGNPVLNPHGNEVWVLTNANGSGGIPEWIRLSVTNPQARVAHSAVYDAASNGMITFAGRMAFYGRDKNDTRVLSNANGLASPSTWTTLAPSGGPPGVREFHSAVYDAATRKMVVFGGTNLIQTCCPYVQSDYNDTWILSDADGLSGTPTWTQIAPAGGPPPARWAHAAVYDSARDRMIVFGGRQWQQASQTHALVADLWELRNAMGARGTPE